MDDIDYRQTNSFVQINKAKLGKYQYLALDISKDDLEKIVDLVKICSMLLDSCKRVRLYINTLSDALSNNTEELQNNDLFNVNLSIDGLLTELYKITEVNSTKSNRYGIRTIAENCEMLAQKYCKDGTNRCAIEFNSESNSIDCIDNRSVDSIWMIDCDTENKDLPILGTFMVAGERVTICEKSKTSIIIRQSLDEIADLVKQMKILRCEVQAHQDIDYFLRQNKDIKMEDVVRGIRQSNYLCNIYKYDDIKNIKDKAKQICDILQTSIQVFLQELLGLYSRQTDEDGNVRAITLDAVLQILCQEYKTYSDGKYVYSIQVVEKENKALLK